MPRTPAVLPASPSAARANAAAATGLARQPGPLSGTIGGLAVAILLASATGASAQAHRDSPEWGGLDHQPTQSEVIQREKQAGVRAPKGQVDQNKRAVDQLDQQLLHDEAVDPPRSHSSPASR
jgi:hypothetical protein